MRTVGRPRHASPLGMASRLILFAAYRLRLSTDTGYRSPGDGPPRKPSANEVLCPHCNELVRVSQQARSHASPRRLTCSNGCDRHFAVYPCWNRVPGGRCQHYLVAQPDGSWECLELHVEEFRICPTCFGAGRWVDTAWECARRHQFEVGTCKCGSPSTRRRSGNRVGSWVCEAAGHRT